MPCLTVVSLRLIRVIAQSLSLRGSQGASTRPFMEPGSMSHEMLLTDRQTALWRLTLTGVLIACNALQQIGVTDIDP